MGLATWARSVRDLFLRERERSISVVGTRAYVAYRKVSEQKLGSFADALRERAREHPNLAEVSVQPFTRRVILRFVGIVPDRPELSALVASAEGAVSEGRARAPEAEPRHARVLPDDAQLDFEHSAAAAADGAALLVGTMLRVVPFFPRGLGTNLYALVFLTSHVELLRKPIERRFGKERTDLGLTFANAAAQALAQRPLASIVDLSTKVANLRELRERRALWERWAPVLTHHDGKTHAELPLPRPCALPKGPIERHLDRAWIVALGTFGVSLITTRNPSRAIAAGFSALPQPARLGRELFAAELGRVFAKKGVLALDPSALRRLDRIDCLVLPAELVARERFSLGDVFALRGISRSEALLLARRLFASDRPLRVQKGEGYSLGPVRLLPQAPDAALEVTLAERTLSGALVLGLSTRDRIVALVEVHISEESGPLEALRAARRAGMQIVLASDDIAATEGLSPDDVIGYRRGLGDGIRRLQSEGRGVCFVGRGPSEGYAAADLGVALCVRDRATPWGAHLLCPDDTRTIETVVAACATAREVSEQSVRLAMGAAALGTLVSAGGPAPRRVMFVLNAASLAAMVNGARRSAAVDGARARHADPTPWHALEARGVLARLGTSEEGLPERAARPSREGTIDLNVFREFTSAVRSEFWNPLSPLLALGAGVSAVVGSMADAGIVAGVGGINALIGGYQRFRAERAIFELVRHAETRVHVRRAGRVRVCLASELVRGDIVLLAQGDVVPADCRILEASSLEVDTSALTGESLPVLKGAAPSFAENIADVTSMLFAGTSIAAGRATAVVVATGADTVARRGASSAPDEMRGGVEARLRELMRLTGPVAFGAGALLVTAGMLRGRRVGDLVNTGVGLAVAAVPEGLPVLATAAQLSAAERLSRRGALVKNARAIEALGRVDVLCMDKTGTLTEGRIEVGSVFDGERTSPVEALSPAQRDVLELASHTVSRGPSADPLDAAIANAARTLLGASGAGNLTKLGERAFESGRGFEAVLLRDADGARICVKGAPEKLMAWADGAIVAGERIGVGPARARFGMELEGLSSSGLRVIALAERRVSESELAHSAIDKLLSDPAGLTLRGLVAFRDPIRPNAQACIQGLASAGVRTVMITGDHPNTADSIAREVSLLGEHPVMHGAQIAQMSEPELEQAVERASVFARVTPAQKVRIVRALQRSGHVVGMVGDGANDAHAMSVADAGIAVGTDSTEAARAAADIVLADADIAALVDVMVEGRAMWTAVRDAVSILVGGNLGEIAFSVAIGGLTGRPPLSPRQLLLVNFLTDIAPSMVIALRPPSTKDLHELRHAGPESSLGAPLDREIISRAITTSMGAGSAWFMGRVSGRSARARTIGLVGLVGTQLGQTLLSGGHSRAVTWTSLGSMAALGLIVQTPGLSQLFGCTPLGPIGWSTALGAAGVATLASPVVDAAVGRVADLIHTARHRPDASLANALMPLRIEPKVIPMRALGLLRN